jgi:hypothetical protein
MIPSFGHVIPTTSRVEISILVLPDYFPSNGTIQILPEQTWGHTVSEIPTANPLEARFKKLADQWRDDTAFDSGANLIWDASYQQIIGMGPSALPFILREMVNNPGHWFWALYSITGTDAASGETTFDGATDAWLEWGVQRGFI